MTKILAGAPLKVTFNGLDARAQARFAMFLQGFGKGICEVVGEDQAEAAIVDLDGFGSEHLWQSFRERFRGPAVVMSVGEKQLPNALWVRKPLSADDFVSAIERIQTQLKAERYLREIQSVAQNSPPPAGVKPALSEQPSVPPRADDRRTSVASLADTSEGKSVDADGLGRAANLAWTERHVHESCGTIEDVVYLDPEHRSELFYEPEAYLQGVLKEACQRAAEASRPVRLAMGGKTIIVLAGGQQVFCDAREHQLRPLCVMPAARRAATVDYMRDNEVPPFQPESQRLLSRETMLWMVSLWASRGRVPKGTNLDAPVGLARWPSFPRLLIPPHGLQISALWTNHPQSLMQTAKLLAIPHRYVFSLYSACLTLDLIDHSSIPTGGVGKRGDEKSTIVEKRGLLGSLLRKLHLAA